MPDDRFKLLLMRHGVEEDQAALIDRAIGMAHSRQSMISQDVSALRSVRRAYFSGSGSRKDYRAYHSKVNNELRQLTATELAFGDIPDWAREQHSAFCWNMYQGHQTRYLDRHEDETVNEFLDRPNKATLNVTKVVINVLSKLYHAPPQRDFDYDYDDLSTAEGVDPEDLRRALIQAPLQARLREVWSSKLFNRTMVDVDRFTRLLGTVAIRPVYDPKVKGKIRNWLFMSHQLRVIPNPARPWEPAAVIERVHPFADPSEGGLNMNVWTDRWVVNMKDGRELTLDEHGLGRVPHVFVRDALSWNSFFVEGRGRDLCDPNAVLNNDLSDLEEIKQLQGFSMLQAVNPTEDDIRVGPRQMARFNTDGTQPFGLEFKSPNAPLRELREDIDSQIRRIFMVNDVPMAAVAASIDQRSLSGEAIRAAMQPIADELAERATIFEPVEVDLADSMLRQIARHESEFHYQQAITRTDEAGQEVTDWVVPEERLVTFSTRYQPLSLPNTTRDQVLKDDFDVAQGITTPAGIMRRDNPDDYPTHEDAVAQWERNREETAGFMQPAAPDDLQASYGGPGGVPSGQGTESLLADDEGDHGAGALRFFEAQGMVERS